MKHYLENIQSRFFLKLLKMAIIAFLSLNMALDMAYANILITPTRVELGSRDRGARLSVVNVSNVTKTYRINWREQAQTPSGQYITLKPNQNIRGLNPASKVIRFSPSQVTLKPGERQHIRFAVRRPKGMKDGEYRSYIVFEASPHQDVSNESEKGAQVKLTLNLEFAIPVILRQGDVDVSSKISEASLIKTSVLGNDHLRADLKISRKGTGSSVGNIKIFWSDKNNKEEKQIGQLNNVAVYAETPYRNVRIGLPTLKAPTDGTLHIRYEGIGYYEGRLLSEYKQKIKATDFKIMKQP